MKLGSERGIKTGLWFQNEMLHSADINALGKLTYQNATDLLASIGKNSGDLDIVIAGLEIDWSTAMTLILRSGSAVSYSGYYLDANDVWGFVASAGDVFSIVVPKDANVAISNGDATHPRIDIIEIRPVETDYNGELRPFKDPITGAVTQSLVDTRRSYDYEFHVVEGTPAASPAVPSSTAGWIKLVEVDVPAGATVLTQESITYTAVRLDRYEKYVDVAKSMTLPNGGGSFHISVPVQLVLPSSPSALEKIDIVCSQFTEINQTDAEHSMVWKNRYFSTKGVTGRLLAKPNTRFLMIYKGNGNIRKDTPDKLSALVALDGNGQDCDFSPDGNYLAFAHNTTPFTTVYKRTGDTFTKVSALAALDGYGYNCSFSPDGVYLAYAHGNTPFATVYKRSGDTFTKVSALASVGGTGAGCDFSPDGNYLAFAYVNTPFATVYKRSGDTFTKVSALAALGGAANGCSFSPDGNYLAFAHDVSPFATVYKRTGDTFTKVSALTALPGQGFDCAFSPDGNYVAFAVQTTPFAAVYKRSGDTFTPVSALTALSGGPGVGCAFSPDGNYIMFGNATTPFVSIYKREGDTFTPVPALAAVQGTGRGCSFSPDGTYVACSHDLTPFASVYKTVDVVTKQWEILNLDTPFEAQERVLLL